MCTGAESDNIPVEDMKEAEAEVHMSLDVFACEYCGFEVHSNDKRREHEEFCATMTEFCVLCNGRHTRAEFKQAPLPCEVKCVDILSGEFAVDGFALADDFVRVKKLLLPNLRSCIPTAIGNRENARPTREECEVMIESINVHHMSASPAECEQLKILKMLIQHVAQRGGALQRGDKYYLGHLLAYPYQCGGRQSRHTHSSGPVTQHQEWFKQLRRRFRGYNPQFVTQPHNIGRLRLPLIWLGRLSPFDEQLRWRTHIITWQGDDIGPEDRHGGFIGHRFCRTPNGGIAAVHFPSDWSKFVQGGAETSDFYVGDHALSGWSKHGPFCCLQPWRCEECTSREWNAACVFECAQCKHRRPYPDVDPTELWSMERAQRLCTSLRHNHGGDNDNQKATKQRKKNRELGRLHGVLYDE